MTPIERVAYDNDFSRAFDEIIRGHSASDPAGRPRFEFDAAARQELEGLIESRRRRTSLLGPDSGTDPAGPR